MIVSNRTAVIATLIVLAVLSRLIPHPRILRRWELLGYSRAHR